MTILEILFSLQKGYRFSTKELAKKYNISLRTAQRYIQLIKLHFPLAKDSENKYFLKEEIILDNAITIETIRQFMKNIGLNPRQSKKFEEEYFFSKLNIEKIDLKLFNEMENAIKKRLKTEIEYKKENVEKKIIKPLKILNFEGYWYVGALNEKNEYRTYHLKSIKKLNTTQKKFKIKKTVLKDLDNAINIWFDPTKKPFEVELQIDNKIIKYLKRIPLSKTQIIIERKDYSIIRLKITHKNEIKRIILSWIPHIVVVTPSGLKKEIDEEVRKYYLKYAK